MRYSLVLLFSLLLLKAHAQNNDTWYKGGYFALVSGYAKPVKEFASQNENDVEAGWALPGVNYEVYYAASFSKFGSIRIDYRAVNNNFDQKSYLNLINRDLPQYQNTFTSTDWKIRVLALGLQFQIPIPVKKLHFEIKLVPGVAFTTSVDQVISITDNSQTPPAMYQAHLRSDKQNAFVLMSGAGLKYDLSDFFSLLLQVDYLYTQPEFQTVISRSGSLYTSKTYNPYKQKMQLLNFNFGVGFNFYK